MADKDYISTEFVLTARAIFFDSIDKQADNTKSQMQIHSTAGMGNEQ